MNSKVTTNSQLSTTKPKTKIKTKQTTRTGTESQKWRSHGGLKWGGEGGNEGKGTGNKKHKCRYKIDRGRLKIDRKWRSQRTYMYDTWT